MRELLSLSDGNGRNKGRTIPLPPAALPLTIDYSLLTFAFSHRRSAPHGPPPRPQTPPNRYAIIAQALGAISREIDVSALEQLLGQLDPATIQRIAGQLGVSPQQAQSGIQAALPLLMGAMQRNASTPQGAQALHRAVVKDHQQVDLGGLLGGLLGGASSGGGASGNFGGAGGLMGAVMGAMGGSQPAQRSPMENGMAILGHVFGGSQPRAATGVARAAGMDSGTAAQLMAMLAPLLMGALGKQTQQRGLDAGGLAGILGQDVSRISGGQASPMQAVLGNVLDKDGDGDVDAADLLAHGAGLLGMFGRR